MYGPRAVADHARCGDAVEGTRGVAAAPPRWLRAGDHRIEDLRTERGVGALNAEIERLIESQERKHFAGDTHRFRKRVAPLRFAQPPRQPQPNRASGCAGLTFEFDCE